MLFLRLMLLNSSFLWKARDGQARERYLLTPTCIFFIKTSAQSIFLNHLCLLTSSDPHCKGSKQSHKKKHNNEHRSTLLKSRIFWYLTSRTHKSRQMYWSFKQSLLPIHAIKYLVAAGGIRTSLFIETLCVVNKSGRVDFEAKNRGAIY